MTTNGTFDYFNLPIRYRICWMNECKYQNEPTLYLKINELCLQKNVHACFYKKNNFQISSLLVIIFGIQIESMPS